MLIVTGASGQLGRRIVDNLLKRVSADQIGVSVRDPAKVADLSLLGVRVRYGDYQDVQSLQHAWAGAERLLLVSSNAAATGGDTLKQHATAIEIARQLKVNRVFYTSQVSSSESAIFPPGRHHAATEHMLSQSGLAWTSMRHGFYANSGVAMNAQGFAQGGLVAPLDGKVCWTSHDDLAAVDAALLAGSETIDGATPPLTGTQALDLADLAAMAGEILGRPVSRTVISDEQMASNASDAGVPQERLTIMMRYYLAARAGEFGQVDPALRRILGREPQTMFSVMSQALQ